MWHVISYVTHKRQCHATSTLRRRNRPCSIYQYSNMAPRLSGQTSIFGVVVFVSKSLLGIEGQRKLEKFAILTRKPRSHARILIYRTWPIENAALFPQLGLPSTLIRHENGAFQKCSWNRRNLKTPAYYFHVDGKHFENEAFQKRWRHHREHTILLSTERE